MRIVHIDDVEEEDLTSPRGRFRHRGKSLSIALGRDPFSTDAMLRHPFDVEIQTVPPGSPATLYHMHSAQWEFYHVISGTGTVRHEGGMTPIRAGNAFLFPPREAHQILNDGSSDLVLFVVADNPFGESGYYPDSGKWGVSTPERRLIRGEPLDYFDGEE